MAVGLILIGTAMNEVNAEQNSAPQILMAGDSTMSIKETKDYPETGWGMPFATFFSEQVTIHNFAKNGRSTKTFRTEGLWKQLIDLTQAGDVVFIQFGHNDESESKVERYTTPQEYRLNLTNYINEVRLKQATPILLSPVSRRYFEDSGKIGETHPYSIYVEQVAKETGVEYIDMDTITRDYFSALGDENSAIRFMHIKPGIHPNYPNGVKDNTHFNELGAREVAQLVLAALKQGQSPLMEHLRPVDPKHIGLHY